MAPIDMSCLDCCGGPSIPRSGMCRLPFNIPTHFWVSLSGYRDKSCGEQPTPGPIAISFCPHTGGYYCINCSNFDGTYLFNPCFIRSPSGNVTEEPVISAQGNTYPTYSADDCLNGVNTPNCGYIRYKYPQNRLNTVPYHPGGFCNPTSTNDFCGATKVEQWPVPYANTYCKDCIFDLPVGLRCNNGGDYTASSGNYQPGHALWRRDAMCFAIQNLSGFDTLGRQFYTFHATLFFHSAAWCNDGSWGGRGINHSHSKTWTLAGGHTAAQRDQFFADTLFEMEHGFAMTAPDEGLHTSCYIADATVQAVGASF